MSRPDIAYDALDAQGRADYGQGAPGGYDPPTCAEALAERHGFGPGPDYLAGGFPDDPWATPPDLRAHLAASLATDPLPF